MSTGVTINKISGETDNVKKDAFEFLAASGADAENPKTQSLSGAATTALANFLLTGRSVAYNIYFAADQDVTLKITHADGTQRDYTVGASTTANHNADKPLILTGVGMTAASVVHTVNTDVAFITR